MTNLFARRMAPWFLCLAVVSTNPALDAQPPSPASAPGANDAILLTIAGTVEVAPAGSAAFAPGQPNQVLHLGDQVRSGKASRATLRLSDKSVLRLYELTTLEVKPPAPSRHNDVIDVKAGATYFFNRDKPQETQFQTPSASGAIRGTEFSLVVRDDGRTELTLLDGQVDLTNEQGSLQLQSGEQATIAKGQAPRKTAALNAASIIQWTLYYPAILDPDELEMPPTSKPPWPRRCRLIAAAICSRRWPNIPANRSPASESERVYHAALLLAVGQVDEFARLSWRRFDEPGASGGAGRRIAGNDRHRSTASLHPHRPPDARHRVAGRFLCGAIARQA